MLNLILVLKRSVLSRLLEQRLPVKEDPDLKVNLAAKLRNIAGQENIVHELTEGARHGDPKFETATNVQKVLDFIDKHLKT